MLSSKARTRSASKWWRPARRGLLTGPIFLGALLQAQQDHAGKAVPDYIHGDECLFCHRNDIGNAWQKNAHGTTVRQREDAPDLVQKLNPPAEAEYFLGSRNQVHFLKKSGYGKFSIRNSRGEWEKDKFADRCAGCHSTGVDA